MSRYKKLTSFFRQKVLYTRVDALQNCNKNIWIKKSNKILKTSKIVLALIYGRMYVRQKNAKSCISRTLDNKEIQSNDTKQKKSDGEKNLKVPRLKVINS